MQTTKPAASGGAKDGLAALLARLHHLSIAVAFLLAVGRLIFVNRCNWMVLVCFVFAPAIALLVAIADDSRWNRRIAEGFLLAVGACVVNSWFDFWPGAFNQFPNLPRADNRVLSGYVFVYHVYGFGIVIPYVLIRSLWRNRQGEPALFSRFESWLFLVIWAIYLAVYAVRPDEGVMALKRMMN